MKILQSIWMIFIMLGFCGCDLTTGSAANVSPRSNEVAEANLSLGVAYLKRGEYEKALAKLNKALSADPGYAPTHNALGLLYQQIGKPEQAEQYYKRALSIKPDDSSTLNNYGQFLCQNNRYDEAQETFLKAANNPLYDAPEIAITNAGTCALKNNQPDVAENYFRNALDKNPKVSVALIQMAELSFRQGNYLSARAYLQRYLEVAEHTANSLWLGIRIEKELGDKNAISSYALSLRNNFPESEEARLLQESGAK